MTKEDVREVVQVFTVDECNDRLKIGGILLDASYSREAHGAGNLTLTECFLIGMPEVSPPPNVSYHVG